MILAEIVKFKVVPKKNANDQDNFYFETVVHYKPVRRRNYVITLNKSQVAKACDEIDWDGDPSAWKSNEYIAEYLRKTEKAIEQKATMTEESELMWEEYEIRVDPESITS